MNFELTERMANVIADAGALKIFPEGSPGTLKSGAESYIFYNFGDFCRGRHAYEVARCFAARIVELDLHLRADFIFGPAYKGIGLAQLISVVLWEEYQIDLPFCSNRKEAKAHGEGGSILGYQPQPGDRGLLIDDVLTMGGAKDESKLILDALDVIIVAIVVGVDRSGAGVIERLEWEFGASVYSVTTHAELQQFLPLPDYADH